LQVFFLIFVVGGTPAYRHDIEGKSNRKVKDHVPFFYWLNGDSLNGFIKKAPNINWMLLIWRLERQSPAHHF
jgi:hypothetical protein